LLTCTLVKANPAYGYHELSWYPGIEKYNDMRAVALARREGEVHWIEVKRYEESMHAIMK